MVVVAGGVCSHIETVSQAVPAAMTQVVRRHMRTKREMVPYTKPSKVKTNLQGASSLIVRKREIFQRHLVRAKP